MKAELCNIKISKLKSDDIETVNKTPIVYSG